MFFLRPAAVCIGLITLISARAPAQSLALIKDATVVTAETLRGQVPVTLRPITSARDVTIVILSDTLHAEDPARLRRELLATFNPPFLASHSLRVVNVSGKTKDASGLLTTAAELQAHLNSQSVSPITNPFDLLATLDAIAPSLPSSWANTIIVGHLPSLPNDEAFVSGWISESYREQRVRVSFWSLDGAAPGWAQNLSASTMGIVITGALSGLLPVLNDKATLTEVSWESKLKAGAWAYSAELRNARGERVASPVTLAVASGFRPPLEPYLSARAAMQAAAANDEPASRKVLDLNPADPDALARLALWRQLTDVTPLDAKPWVAMAFASYAAEAFDDAEDALKTASHLGLQNRQTFELQARLLLHRGDYGGALPLVDQALAAGQDQALFLLRADCARNLKRWPLEADSLEHARALGTLALDKESRLIADYLSIGQSERALPILRAASSRLPRDAASYAQYADFWEQLHDPASAELLWKSALETDPKFEPAYVGLARNYLASKRPGDAKKIASQGLEFAPESLSLILIEEDALESLGELYAARRLLSEHAATAKDIGLLKRRAQLEDRYGSAGADAYSALLKALTKNNSPQTEVVEVCHRGLMVALRDEQLATAKIFAETLATAGDRGGLDLLQTTQTSAVNRTELLGGVNAFHFLMFGGGKPNPDRILIDYARALMPLVPVTADKSRWQAEAQRVHEYFQRLAALSALGDRKASAFQIQLTLATKAGRQRTEKALSILGLKLKGNKEDLTITSSEGKSQTRKQDTLAALAIDDQSMQEALAAGKVYTLEIPVDVVPAFPAAALWQQAFYSHDNYPGGLAEAIISDPRLSQLYLALNSMDRSAAQALIAGVTLRTLAERYSVPLSIFSAALAMSGSHAEVPGGGAAEPVWQALAGASPANSINFFEALLTKDSGRLVAYFYTLSQLDFQHQKFFMRSPERAKRFYDLFRESSEMRGGGDRRAGGAFLEFLRDIPLNDDGSVDFPGAPEVWMVAKGAHASGTSVAKMTRQLQRSAAPDDEDEILIRLAKTEYKTQSGEQSELGNFVAVSRLDAQRDEPLTPSSALLLAQGYSQFRGLYPYFAELGDLETADYQNAFSLEAKFAGLDFATINMRLGELHSTLAMLGLLRESGVMPAKLFLPVYRKCLDRFLAANDGGAWTLASLGAVDDMAHSVVPGNPSRDAAVRALLIGASSGLPSLREKSFEQILALQKVPSLDAIFTVIASLKKTNDTPQALDEIQRQLASFTVLAPPKTWKLSGDEKRYVELFDTATAQSIVAKMREKLAKKKRNQADIEKLAGQLTMELEPWTELAMAGRIYARFLDPSDLLVSDDAMLLRKHEFVKLGTKAAKVSFFTPADLFVSSEGAGSKFIGGLAEFSLAAGQARAVGNHLGGSGSTELSSALIASIRATDWRILTAPDLQSFGATVRLAREWIVESAVSQPMHRELEEESRGILSLTRRKTLLEAIDHHDWPAAWGTVSISDLHFLGDELLDRAPKDLWNQPALNAMKLAAAHAKEFDALGSAAPNLSGCAQPRLRRYEPYEEYQRHMLPARLSQRLSELKLSLAWLADSSAWQPSVLAGMAGPAADAFLAKLQMHDMWDWGAVLDAYRGLKAENLEQFLKQ